MRKFIATIASAIVVLVCIPISIKTAGAGLVPDVPPRISTTSSLQGTVNQPFQAVFQVNGGKAPYQWKIKDLPSWLSIVSPLNQSTVTLAGTPNQAGSFLFTLVVTDKKLRKAKTQFTITINPDTTPIGDFSISCSPTSATVAPGGSTRYMISATPVDNFNQAINLTVSPVNGLSTVLGQSSIMPNVRTSLDVSIIPSLAPGHYDINVSGRSGSLTHTVACGLDVANNAVLQITDNANLPNATPNQSYQYQFHVIGGSGAYAWSLAPDTTGCTFCSIDATSGLLTATPPRVGSWNLTVAVADRNQPTLTTKKQFFLSAPAPTDLGVSVLTPQGGEHYQTGQTITLQWRYDVGTQLASEATVPTIISLQTFDWLTNQAREVYRITNSAVTHTNNISSFNWTIPASYPTGQFIKGDNFRVMVLVQQRVNGSYPSGVSPSTFNIAPSMLATDANASTIFINDSVYGPSTVYAPAAIVQPIQPARYRYPIFYRLR